MVFPLTLASNCILRQNVIQLIFYFLLLFKNHSIASVLLSNHSIDLLRRHSITSVRVHSIVSITMPVTTRSMTKQALNTTCIIDPSILSSSSTQISSSKLESSNRSLSNDVITKFTMSDDHVDVFTRDDFEISKFQNNLYLSVTPDPSMSHFTLESSQNLKMESNETSAISTKSEDSANECILQMLSMVSNQMMVSIQDLQAQLSQSNAKLSQDIRQITEDHNNFKQEIRQDMASLRQSPDLSSSVLSSSTTQVTQVPQVPDPSPVTSSVSVQPSVSSSLGGSSPTDMQLQMLHMLNETFSKLSVVLDTKSSDSKTEWPKFQGDIKKFRGWYMAIIAQICLPPWKEFYDSMTNKLVPTTTNTALNEKLYAKILTCFEGQVLQNMVSRKHLRANGLALLQELVQTYRPKNVPEVIAAKTGEFWSNTKRNPGETVDCYYNRFHELLDDLIEGEEPISD
jgi:hypothetical protein